ncbi:MAG: MGMT family protein [Bacteroidetes bacterium]|nr:MGMT family protein [Bacteroidota bacterium]
MPQTPRRNQEDFYLDVYAVVQCVPPGRVTSYGAIAEFLGSKGAARLVGYAMNALPLYQRNDVPAHRVVNRNGLLTGKHHFGEPNRMQELLEAEGVVVQDDQVQDMDRVFWHPSHHLTDTI